MRLAFAFSAAAAFALSALSSNAETLSITDVPEHVYETAIQTAPGVSFDRVTAERENGVLIYEFEARSFDGKHIEVDVREDGSLEEVEMEMSESELPELVRAAIEDAHPGFEIAYIEASIRGDWTTVYEVEGSTAKGEELALDLSESGEILQTEKRSVS